MIFDLPQDPRFVLKILNKHGFEGYIVGGAIRDMLLGNTPNDWDISTNAGCFQVTNIFESLGYEVLPTGIKYGTVTVIVNCMEYQITTYEKKDKVDRVNRATMLEDLSCRDFTINAMAYNEKDGLVDIYDGMKDLKKGVIKSIGNPFHEMQQDPARILRAIRFKHELGFKIDKKTLKAMKKNSYKLYEMSTNRLRNTFIKILLGDRAEDALYYLKEEKLLKFIIPELEKSIDYYLDEASFEGDLFDHLVYTTKNTKREMEARMAALIHDIGKTRNNDSLEMNIDMSKRILRRLLFDNEAIEVICKQILSFN